MFAKAPVTLAVVDDHALLVDSISSWFDTHAQDFDIVVRATSWSECLANQDFPTQVVLMDYQLSEEVSIVARVLTCKAAGSRVVVMSALTGPEIERLIYSAGADAYFDKSTPMSQVASAMRELVGLPAQNIPQQPVNSLSLQHADPPIRPRLSQGELEALLLFCQGLAIKEIAESMNVQFETAKTYIRRVREKYARAGRPASRRAELVRRAAEDGYLT